MVSIEATDDPTIGPITNSMPSVFIAGANALLSVVWVTGAFYIE